MITNGNKVFAYDDENQLTAVWVTNTWKSTFMYDGKMRRRIRKEYTWTGNLWAETNEVRYLYDGNLPIQERDWNNLPLVTYTRGNDLSGSLEGAGGIGGLLARAANPSGISPQLFLFATALYHADANGNITALIYTNQTIAAKYQYDPFGNILSQSGPLAAVNVYRFSSKEYDAASGLIYYLRRFYDPNLQRWLNRDPIQELGGINLYDCVLNDPINSVDMFGLADCAQLKKLLESLLHKMQTDASALALMYMNQHQQLKNEFLGNSSAELAGAVAGYGAGDIIVGAYELEGTTAEVAVDVGTDTIFTGAAATPGYILTYTWDEQTGSAIDSAEADYNHIQGYFQRTMEDYNEAGCNCHP